MQHSTYVWNLARFGNSIMYINLFTMLKQYLFLMYSLNPLDVKIQFLIVLPLISQIFIKCFWRFKSLTSRYRIFSFIASSFSMSIICLRTNLPCLIILLSSLILSNFFFVVSSSSICFYTKVKTALNAICIWSNKGLKRHRAETPSIANSTHSQAGD